MDGDVDIINNSNSDLNTWWSITPNRPTQVSLHELGHMLGLGHSSEADAIMAPYHDDLITELQCDDEAGITALYPSGAGSVNCDGGNAGNGGGTGGGGECPTCPGDGVVCCSPRFCNGRRNYERCRGG